MTTLAPERPTLETRKSSKKERVPAAESAKVQHLARGLSALGISDDEARYLAQRRPQEANALATEKNGAKRGSLMRKLLGRKISDVGEKEV